MIPTVPAGWILLVVSLPGRQTAARMRLWRALKAAGTAVLRDGVYLLPDMPSARGVFAEQARLVTRSGGQGHVLTLGQMSATEQYAFCALFDRGPAFARLSETLRGLRAASGSRRARTTVVATLRKLRREVAALRATDYFPGPAAQEVEQLLAEVEAAQSPGEPQTRAGAIARLNARDYRNRVWATRAHPWVDRLASAWLIRRFIDPKARFVWLKDPKRCPKGALGFDFDGAAFTHMGSRVTFEVLAASFGLEGDPALLRIGAIVHQLDVGGAPVAEAAGLAMILNGARARATNDDRLLIDCSRTFDDLYAAFSMKQGETG